jgi:hypothetical protein
VPTAYTVHARLRMAKRHIAEAEVEQVLAIPSGAFYDLDGNLKYRAIVNGRRLCVVVKRHSEPPLVITVWIE